MDRRWWLAGMLCAGAWPAVAGGLVGSIVPPYPDGLVPTTGTCISASDRYEHVCAYGIGVLADAALVPRLVHADKAAWIDADGKAHALVIATLPYPAVPEGFHLAIGTCRRDGVDDRWLLAVVDARGDGQYWSGARWAARLDPVDNTLRAQSPAGVECLNEAAGL